MKPLHLITALLLLSTFSCKSDAGDPVAATKDFVAATNESRFADARKMATANYLPILDMLEKRIASMPKEDKEKMQKAIDTHSQQYKLQSKTAETAEVLVFSDSSPISIIFTLKNVDGKWMVDRQDENY